MEFPPKSVAASPDAVGLANQMLEAAPVMRAVLTEMIESGEQGQIRESGRTTCGTLDDVRGPVERFPTSVSLASCPVGLVGIWHTHPTERGLRDPVHSLPDWANVLYGFADASIVVGTRTSEVVVAPTEPAREAAVDAFRNALGADVEGTEDVVSAVRDGRINDPAAARQRVRAALPELVDRRETSFPDLEVRSETLAIPAWSPTRGRGELSACGSYHGAPVVDDHHAEWEQFHGDMWHFEPGTPPRPRSLALHARAKGVAGPLAQQTTDGISVREIAISSAIGQIVGQVINRVLFGA